MTTRFIGECVSSGESHNSSEHLNSHRAYIARMLGDLLEDVDPCEAVEYVIPLLSGFAMDEGTFNRQGRVMK